MKTKATDWVELSLDELRCAGLHRQFATRESPQGGTIQLDGQSLINFGSNDYLGLANELPAAVAAALGQYGWGSGASPLITGRSKLHTELQDRLATFERQPAALLFGSGYAANVGTITSLVGRGDVVYSDAKNHASIIDGCRLSRARIQIFQHRDVSHLRELLRQDHSGRRLIVSDSLFSMDGDLAPLAELAQLASEYDAMLVVDEAHATGVFGESGRGVSELLDVESAITLRVGTLSKALGSIGGFVVGSSPLIEWISQQARPYFFSTAPPAATCAAALAALDVVDHEPDRRTQVGQASSRLRRQLSEQGWDVGDSGSQIIPLFVTEPDRAMELSGQLRERGLYVPGIRPPTVPEGESMLRISLSYSHSDEHIEQLVDALAELQ